MKNDIEFLVEAVKQELVDYLVRDEGMGIPEALDEPEQTLLRL